MSSPRRPSPPLDASLDASLFLLLLREVLDEVHDVLPHGRAELPGDDGDEIFFGAADG